MKKILLMGLVLGSLGMFAGCTGNDIPKDVAEEKVDMLLEGKEKEMEIVEALRLLGKSYKGANIEDMHLSKDRKNDVKRLVKAYNEEVGGIVNCLLPEQLYPVCYEIPLFIADDIIKIDNETNGCLHKFD